jgi:tRNA (guanine37-N1)-methyltransferase
MQPLVISTTARQMNHQISLPEIAGKVSRTQPLLLLFGTGFGLTDDVHASADLILKPVQGLTEYNHLSVRSAVAIILDRITSAVYKGRN